MPEWETVVGLEVHARLLTRSKIFCACSTAFGSPPNTQVCPVCLGYPGALPVLNRQAVELALRVAVATGCRIHLESVFARKNYFYPDLPKGYQISQFDRPLATGGSLPIRMPSGTKRIAIRRIHLEEDAGKLVHDAAESGPSLVDLNRAGVPLIEIVSEPDIGSAEEAAGYLTHLRQVLMYAGACDGNMEEGSLRCDANVSVRLRGEGLGTRSEIKNLNSFRFVRNAIEFEIDRQIDLLESGERVVQETRLFDAATGRTRAMRSKEEAHDYRYFPEPDLLPLRFGQELVDEAASSVPPLPWERIERYMEVWGLSVRDADVLVASREVADYFEETARLTANPRTSGNWVRNEVLGLLNERKIGIEELAVRPADLAALIGLVESGSVGGKAAKEIFQEMADTGGDPRLIAGQRGLSQIDDASVIREAAVRVLAANAAQVEQYRGGKSSLFGFFVGQLMKETGGKANAGTANRILRELLDPGKTNAN